MRNLHCPYCFQRIKIQDYIVAAVVSCPDCTKVFFARRDPSMHTGWFTEAHFEASDTAIEDEPLHEEAEQIPRLIAPHPCHQCHAPITQVIGKSRTTLKCPTCQNSTSVYAVHFRCRECNVLLEAPTAEAGNPHPCPSCRKTQVVPGCIVEDTVPKAEGAADWFGFYCPSCWDNVVVKKTDVGRLAACPHCQVTFTVPHCGHQAETAVSAPSPLLEKHCPRCALLIPLGAAVCPMCTLDLQGLQQE